MTCSVDGCGKPVRNSRGWCSAHYERWLNHGDPLGGRTPRGEPVRYLREHVLTYDGDDCLVWPYARLTNGYGHMYFHGKSRTVSSVVCEQIHGPAPTQMHEAAHSCGKGHEGCITPRHLRWATPVENRADKLIHGTANLGERNGSAKLTEADVLEIRSMKGMRTQQKIADKFGVSRSLISMLHSGKVWEAA